MNRGIGARRSGTDAPRGCEARWSLGRQASESLPKEVMIELNLKVGEKMLSRKRKMHMQKPSGRLEQVCLENHSHAL